jgi:protein ImuB
MAEPPTPARSLVVRCPDWPVVALGVPADLPAAVVHANRVVACSPAARAAGVEVGLRRRESQGRCPALEVLERDEPRERRAFEVVVAAVETFTPRIEVTHPGACAFATRGPSRYFGGDRALAGAVRGAVLDALDAHGPVREAEGPTAAVAVGVADGPFAASLAAGRPDSETGLRVVDTGASPAFLAPLPVAVLRRSRSLERERLVDVLVRLGLPTLGAFAALAPADVVGRFGADGLAAHRLASGLDEHPPAARVPLPDLMVTTELDPPADQVAPVAFAGKALADELHRRLSELGLACTRVAIEAETEHAEHQVRLWRDEGALTPGAVADRVRWQLDGWLNGTAARRPTSGVTRLTLTPDEVVAAKGRQLGFWGEQTESAERAARALARVEGLLGPEAVGVPEWRGGRSAVEQVTLVPVGAVDLTGARPATEPGWVQAPWPGRLPAPSPATVYHDPLPVEVVDTDGAPVVVSGRGMASAAPARLSVAGGPWRDLVSWAGPWPLDERWWDHHAHRRRARFQVVTADGVAHVVFVEAGCWRLEATYD